jgi:hypothetical protein
MECQPCPPCHSFCLWKDCDCRKPDSSFGGNSWIYRIYDSLSGNAEVSGVSAPGNLNAALARTSSPYVVTFDAECINESFQEKRRRHLGFVQTPQRFCPEDRYIRNFSHTFYDFSFTIGK